MSSAATLKVALRENSLTLAQLLALPERDALRLPWVGPRVLAEARRQSVPTRGGAREGAGRKAKDGATGLEQIAIRVTPEQRDKLKRLGGSVWVRRQIDEAD